MNDSTINLSNHTNTFTLSLGFYDWCLILISLTIFLIGLIGNLLVIVVVIKNAQMRTITNLFIVNLAIGDFLVILICLPTTMINDITGNWWFGLTMCKVMVYVQVNSPNTI
jgi:hypocretin (orexin) receptor 2